MTEPPSKRFKQRSLTEFTFAPKPKPKISSVLQTSKVLEQASDNLVITISDSQSDSSPDDKMADLSKSITKDAGKEKMESETETKSPKKEAANSSDRKRPNTDMLTSPPVTSSKIIDSETVDSDDVKTKDADGTQDYNMSPDLFTDSEPLTEGSQQEEDEQEAPPSSHTTEPLGTPIKDLNRTVDCSPQLPDLTANQSHTVLFYLPYKLDASSPERPYPHPQHYKDRWDNDHVKMPCSHQNEYPVEGQAKRRWNLIDKALRGNLNNAYKLQEAILSYNTRYASRWDFSALKQLFYEEYSPDDTEKFFTKTLKRMAMLALRLPNLCTQPIPLLKKGKSHSITLSQQQISCLLANAFFCTFPRRNTHGKNAEYSSYPDINFNSLFSGSFPATRKLEKLKCIIHYFERVTDPNGAPFGNVTFTRQILEQLPDWNDSRTQLRNLHVATNGTIEDDGKGMLQVDFANKYIGGGALSRGLVQEEIRFMICPEMIISRLFTEVLEKNECLIMTGCERYSNYTGYADSFRWSGDHYDTTLRDEWGRLCTEVVAIDAMVIRNYSSQFKAYCVKRELDKSYCGFYKPQALSNYSNNKLSAVCTGNWGCGAFGGEKQLKALIQLMAAAEAGRDVCYFTFHDAELQDELYKVHGFLKDDQNLCIADILKIIQQYYRNVCDGCPGRPDVTLFDYIHQVFEGMNDSSDAETDQSSQETKTQWEKKEFSEKGKLKGETSFDYKAETP